MNEAGPAAVVDSSVLHQDLSEEEALTTYFIWAIQMLRFVLSWSILMV